MDIQTAIKTVIARQDLSGDEMTSVMRQIMTGECTPSQIGGFLVGLHMKGESVDEISAAAAVMRELATRVDVDTDHLVDTAGTGGDSSGSFNISTASALVAAAAGARVAKHGNRSMTSNSGSADVLEAAGVRLDISPEKVAACIDGVGVGFMFAPAHHGAMKHAIGARKELAVRTVFNVLGPLTNPAGAPNQVIGVFHADLVELMANVLQQLGSRHVMVVHSEDGMDEISISAPTRVAELKDGKVTTYTITPADFGMETASLDELRVASAEESLAKIRDVFADKPGPARDIVCLNAGAAIYVSGLADTLAAGVEAARSAISSGRATEVLENLVRQTNA
ncbi:MAG: anthranilate phosphoribosyltransferase [Gammaproteobacteria bacterium]|nr:anthranilate phosphoribosyltransferase [Gammaproteobacteria bacterium]MDH3449715.1 anthranilate phosphoribosyltransferase [Gammaproteobacteria bacterium]